MPGEGCNNYLWVGYIPSGITMGKTGMKNYSFINITSDCLVGSFFIPLVVVIYIYTYIYIYIYLFM